MKIVEERLGAILDSRAGRTPTPVPSPVVAVRAVVLCWNNTASSTAASTTCSPPSGRGRPRGRRRRQRIHRRLGGPAGRSATPPSRSSRPARNLGYAGGVNRGLADLDDARRRRAGELRRVRGTRLAGAAGGGPRRRRRPRGRVPEDPVASPGRRPTGDQQRRQRPRGRLGAARPRATARPTPASTTTPEDVWGWCGAAVLLRRRYLDDVGRFDERLFMYAEDVDLDWRGAAAGVALPLRADLGRAPRAPGQLRRRAHAAARLPQPPQPPRRGDPPRWVPRRGDRLDPGPRRHRRSAWAPTARPRSCSGDGPTGAVGAASACGVDAGRPPGGRATPRCRRGPPSGAGHRAGDRRAGLRRPPPHRAPARARRRRHRARPPRRRSVDITDGAAVDAGDRRGRSRRRVPPRRLGRRGRLVEAPVEAFRANAEGTLNVLLACRAAGVDRVLSVAQRRRLRRRDRGTSSRSPRTHRSGRPARTPRSKVAADFLGPAGVPRPRARRAPRPRRSTTSARPVRAVRRAGARRAHRRATSATAATRSRSATCPPAATSPTCATSCGPTGCSSSTASPARSTTCARRRHRDPELADHALRMATVTDASSSPTRRCSAPVDIPVLRGDTAELRDGHRLDAGDPHRPDARRPPRGHARARRRRDQAGRARRSAFERLVARASLAAVERGAAGRPADLDQPSSGAPIAGALRASARSLSSSANCSSTSVWRATTSGSRSAFAERVDGARRPARAARS